MNYGTVVHLMHRLVALEMTNVTPRAKPRAVRFDPDRPLSGRLPPLIMLRAFEATARTGSMRKAASDIGISHTVISRHVRSLELWIGWKLLTAGPRGVDLTQEGQSLYATTSVAFQSIANISAQLRAKAGADELHIWCYPGLATRWLIPRLDEVRSVVSSGEVLLRATDQMPDFARGEADVMIGFGEFGHLPDGAVPILEPRMFPVVSAKWLDRHEMPASIDELACLPLIHEESYAQWASWLMRAGATLDHPLKGPRLWDANLGFDAALAGQGVALTSNLMVADEIEQGSLVELFKTDIRVGGYFLVTPANALDERVGRFKEWIACSLNAHEFARNPAYQLRRKSNALPAQNVGSLSPRKSNTIRTE
ncbi:LysR family transcriptional regulator [Mesorhizobium sp. L-8-10]|uniref:LysR substrate-binding domain-containing protein n=1 Tax=Mesorhizobium sp. L-8-10 TaxID=2744523 RepID=UPI001929317C|nr:LysR substrate-binding domain-containing protein [Mesorhizobium sp. L-8-10]BCH29886.1 LysR family transcriptional regulator [Mesorhizobium sp. L-8-10]